jgi:hypothetical protein
MQDIKDTLAGLNYWKILGGAAVGVVAIVASPIAGPVGAISLIGAGIAAVTGAGAGVVADQLDDKGRSAVKQAAQRGKEHGESLAKAKHEQVLALLAKDLELRRAEENKYFDYLLALAAVGIACANCDGHISDEEHVAITEFVVGVVAGALPDRIKQQLVQMQKEPPSIVTAFALAMKVGADKMPEFDDVIEMVCYADGHLHEKEAEFKAAWAQLKAA